MNMHTGVEKVKL